VKNMNDKITESAKPHDGVIQLRNLMDAILAGAIDAEVDVASRNISEDINPTVAGTPPPVGSPDLGTAQLYAALAGAGITNTGTSVFHGNIGSYPTFAVTGVTTPMVSGTLYTASSSIVAQAKVDAAAAYAALVVRPVTATIASALDGQTLTAGVYDFASGAATLATSGNGTLTFHGSATDIFVIKTATTLTTGAGGIPTIAFTGGALASNVYFAVGSSATINSGFSGTFNGNILAQVSITNTMGGTINGSLIALTGAITYSAAGGTTSKSEYSIIPTPAPGTSTDVSGQYVQYDLR
jgi:hypothetical protein